MTTTEIQKILVSVKGKSFWSYCIRDAATKGQVNETVQTICDAANDNMNLVTHIIGKDKLIKILSYAIDSRIVFSVPVLDSCLAGEQVG